jgi:hypothetical protein
MGRFKSPDENESKNKSLINRLGLLGVVSFLSYMAAVILAPLAYPGYNWMSRAVSDLSAANAPSLALWTQLSAFYGLCGITCITLVCIFIQGRLNRGLRMGIYLFAIMQWVSGIGYTMFQLSDAGYTEAASNASVAMTAMFTNIQDAGHIVVTALVIALSIISLSFIIAGGFRKKRYVSLAVWATVALIMMMIGGIGTGVVPKEIFGVFQRFSNISATGFNALLGVYLFNGFRNYRL